MVKDNLKLTSSEIGTLWGEYVNGTMTDIVNKKNKWLEQPPLAPNRKELAQDN